MIREGDRDCRQDPATPLQDGKESAAQKQERQDNLPPERITVSQCGGGVLALGKAHSARLRILQDIFGHAAGRFAILSNRAVQTGSTHLSTENYRFFVGIFDLHSRRTCSMTDFFSGMAS